MRRRTVLSIVGGGVVIAAGGFGFVATRTPTQALAPWSLAGDYQEPRRRALSYAILAPNPHNRQPWKVDLGRADEITLLVDRDRLLPATDPLHRQITIGLGCFLELLRMAAAADGYRAEIEPFPLGSDDTRLDDRPVATVRLIRDDAIETDPLFAQTLRRRSLKEPYDTTRAVPDTALAALRAAVLDGVGVGVSNDADEVAELRALTREALLVEVRTPVAFRESVDLFRIGKTEIEANPDGIDFSGAFFETLSALDQFNRDVVADPESSAFQQGLAAVTANADTAMAFIWLTTRGNTRLDQLNAGRDWLRVNLAATALDLGTQPLSQALQEYPEMAPLYRRAHRRLAAAGDTVQMLARLGYGPEVAPSPRWRVDAKIVTI